MTTTSNQEVVEESLGADPALAHNERCSDYSGLPNPAS
jgi:hypothetical protein